MEGPAVQPERQVAAGPQLAPEQAIITPSDIRKILIKRKWLILAGIVVGLAFAAVYILTTIPQYEAIALIDINEGQQSNIGISELVQQEQGGIEADLTRTATEIAIMQSDTVSLDVINSLDLYHKQPFAQVFVRQPYNGKLTPNQRIEMLSIFKGSTKIATKPGTQLVEVRFRNQSPAVAASVSNAIVDRYMDRSRRARYEGTTRISEWLAKQLEPLKNQVTESQDALSTYQKQNNLIGVDSNGSGQDLTIEDMRVANQQLSEAQADRVVKEARYRMAMTRNPELLLSVAPSATLSQLQQQAAALTVQQAQLQSKFGPEWPRVKEVQGSLVQVRKAIDVEINNMQQRFQVEYETALSTENLMRKRLEDAKQQAYQQNRSSAEYQILRHGADSASDLYDALQTRLKEAGITAGLNATQIDIVDRAVTPALPVFPVKRNDAAIGLAAGLVLGLALALFAETIDDTIRTSDDAESVVGLPSLAVIPHFEPAQKKGVSAAGTAAAEAERERMARVSPDLISYTEPQSYVSEGFRTLRSSILLSAVDREPKLILLTSSFATEGKSTCAANLAISFARRSARVLLVDTDLRKGTLHMKFRTSNRFGLSTLLVRENEESSYENPLPDLPNLTLVTRGPVTVNPGEALASRSMEELLQRWRSEYDHIILDSSPVLAVADTLSIAPQVDACFILVRSGVTRKKALLRTREQMRRVNSRVQGIIVNDVDLRLENYYTYSKRYNYSYNSTYGAGYGGGMDAEQ
ncbi:polysaccharide biosynthesis tyrosine autokinase [Acidipila sp. EB88]|uniref:GumC family protein n=1 Tax=Acidipila sp. EB88 TaxID=2305226 RepID=UPI000F5DBABF|nr:polysaccharide biosynthesis tyrosine autokinase [Acidipila sp. EB88]RRA49682.1 polysaccharide biosynthesis tyrosine autokinase [Acidipila sp. EB88]